MVLERRDKTLTRKVAIVIQISKRNTSPNRLIPQAGRNVRVHGPDPNCFPRSRKSYRCLFSSGLLLLLVIVPKQITTHDVGFIVLSPVVIPFGIFTAWADRNEHKGGMCPGKNQSDGRSSKFIFPSSSVSTRFSFSQIIQALLAQFISTHNTQCPKKKSSTKSNPAPEAAISTPQSTKRLPRLIQTENEKKNRHKEWSGLLLFLLSL